ncbi:hypothetical protein KP509_26G064100 [Ceratopteris richardii]|uniref:Aminotransferase class V domain-containing protein n=1 Tax=Ceratopteris richardii TaxID=49495 RepID=A0A8T2RLK7_CERRI|nr:hypothetical protein KP509_26G064100 [Ceratopteris richardii]
MGSCFHSNPDNLMQYPQPVLTLNTPILKDDSKQPQNQKETFEDEDRVFNFAAGPATLPASVLKQTQAEPYNWRGSGMSVMEMSHRGKEFLSVIQNAEASLRSLLNIPDDYVVLFLQGGATTQFSSAPLNLCKAGDAPDYIDLLMRNLQMLPL